MQEDILCKLCVSSDSHSCQLFFAQIYDSGSLNIYHCTQHEREKEKSILKKKYKSKSNNPGSGPQNNFSKIVLKQFNLSGRLSSSSNRLPQNVTYTKPT